MPKEIVSTDDAPKGLAGYSQAVKANGLVFVSGQGPFDPTTGDVVGENDPGADAPVSPKR